MGPRSRSVASTGLPADRSATGSGPKAAGNAPGGRNVDPAGDASPGRAGGPRRASGRGRRLRAPLIGGSLVVFLLIGSYVAQPFVIPSRSMQTTLEVGDRVLVNKLAYRFGGEIRRGDVVVFDGTGVFSGEGDPTGPLARTVRTLASSVGIGRAPGDDYVKRVIGLGGDRVRCCDERGRIEINDVPLDEPWLRPGETPSEVEFDIRVPEGRLWVMGDHRSDSVDSRDLLGRPGGGTVPEDRVIGRAEAVVWPPARHASLRVSGG
ncbi:signal peptidase I [Streptomyces calidiresistens]|uniref:Signal peptidase I n=1 Tax=Streptomyces calidiresistens TaxID=1485586 RepID=A0A7W3T3A6_9ACTN|nr:signal peptidase I [Streptomyces calidiresistens]